MIVIADSNILFSGLYAPEGVIATILKNEKNIQFTAPSYVYEEIKEHLPKIIKNTNKTKNSILKLLDELLENVKIYDVEKISKLNIRKAVELVKDIDIDDYPFVALHFQTKHKIWTTDKALQIGLKNKGYDICITTTELKETLYKKIKLDL